MIAVLRKLAEHLNADGRIVLSYASRKRGWANRSVVLARLAGWLTRSDWRVEPYDAIQRLDVEGETLITFDHFFVGHEVEREAEQAGLRVHAHESEPWSQAFAVLGR